MEEKMQFECKIEEGFSREKDVNNLVTSRQHRRRIKSLRKIADKTVAIFRLTLQAYIENILQQKGLITVR